MLSGDDSRFLWQARPRLGAENQLTSVINGSTEQYAHDFRIRRASAGSHTFLYNGFHPILATGPLSNTEHVLFGPGVDEVLAISSDSIAYSLTDSLDSVVGFASTTGTIIRSVSFDAWGETAAAQGSASRWSFTGREGISAELLYYRFRHYSPTLGRFLSEDPLREYVTIVGGALYSYVENQPVNFSDPFGLQKCKKNESWGEKQIHHEMGTQWVKWGTKSYPDVTTLGQGMKKLITLFGKKAPKKGIDLFGATKLICYWTKYLYTLKYWTQDYTVTIDCECPDETVVISVPKGGLIGGTKKKIDHAMTEGSIGMVYEPCEEPAF